MYFLLLLYDKIQRIKLSTPDKKAKSELKPCQKLAMGKKSLTGASLIYVGKFDEISLIIKKKNPII